MIFQKRIEKFKEEMDNTWETSMTGFKKCQNDLENWSEVLYLVGWKMNRKYKSRDLRTLDEEI